jgi:alkylated DNA repair dioxygenase AlkB
VAVVAVIARLPNQDTRRSCDAGRATPVAAATNNARRHNVPVKDAADQLALFGAPPAPPGTPLPPGWDYRTEFIDAGEEAELLALITTLPLHEARYKGYTARRRVAHFGTAYDYDDNRLLPGPPLPPELKPLRTKAAAWVGEAPEALSSALVAEYQPGVPLGWHRDVPDFETVVGISLAGTVRMRFRRYPPVAPKKADVVSLELAPRSAYVLRAEARWGWQHSVAPAPALRYSITFRTRATRSAARRA